MPPTIVISYDGSAEDADGIALGRVFADAGASVALAYVRHARLADAAAEAREQDRADELLARGAKLLGLPDARQLTVFSPSTAIGLKDAIAELGGDIVVFGSAYRTTAGNVYPGLAAERLLDGGTTAVAIAPARLNVYGTPVIKTIAVSHAPNDEAPPKTAAALASVLDATVIDAPGRRVDLLIVGSRPDAAEGCVSITAVSEKVAAAAGCPVLILARARPIAFDD